MNKISTFEFQASLETLRDAAAAGTIPQDLLEPLQSLLTPLIEDAARHPSGMYLFSADKEKELRDLFGFCLVRALQPHAKTSVLVDCDFLDPGLSGLVPQRDSLGFLDLLLYGSSMKAIVQKSAGGAFVVGAGSFQVTKKLPFSMESFRGAARYLLNQARCVIFCGPAEDDAGEPHPMAGAFESVLCIRTAGAAGDVPFGRFLEKIASLEESNVFVVNIVQPQRWPAAEARTVSGAAESRTLEETPAKPAPEPEKVHPAEPAKEQPKAPPVEPAKEQPKAPPVEPAKEPPKTLPVEPPKAPVKPAGAARVAAVERNVEFLRQRSRDSTRRDAVEEGITGEAKSSFLPKAVTSIVAVILVAFVFWWLFLTKTVREGETERISREIPKTAVPSAADRSTAPDSGAASRRLETAAAPSTAAGSGEVMERADTTAARTEPRSEELAARSAIDTARARVPALKTADATPPPPETASRQEPTETAAQQQTAGNIEVYRDLMPMAGKFLIHISSFRGLAHAEEDARYLQEHGYRVFIGMVDLGGKGTWYRVYVGPLETREEAREIKLNVETLSRVKFTRIMTAP